MIQFSCTNCRKSLKISENNAGKRGKCPSCQTIIDFPVLDSDVKTQSNSPQNSSLTHPKTTREHLSASSSLCSKCNSPLMVGSIFCSLCGTKVIPEDICKQCGAKFVPNAKFCGGCGNRLNNDNVDNGQMQGSIAEMYENPEKLIFHDGSVKHPWLAVALNCLWGGLGQLYLGQTGTAVFLMVLNAFFLFLTVGFVYIFIMILSTIWAYQDAVALNNGYPIYKSPTLFRRKPKLKTEYR